MAEGETSPKILQPYDGREACALKFAAGIANRSPATLRAWCDLHGLGRRVPHGGPWQISRVALLMWLDGDVGALAAYHAGDRESMVVRPYFERVGIDVETLGRVPGRRG